MGQSTDALLVYGYVWGEEHDLFSDSERDDYEWPLVIANKRGIPNPWDDFRKTGIEELPYDEQKVAYERWRTDHREEIDDHYKVQRQIEDEYGCVTDSHCSHDYPMPIIRIKDVGKRAARGDVVRVHVVDLVIQSEWDDMLQKFVDDLEIDTTEADGPGWFLVSDWG